MRAFYLFCCCFFLVACQVPNLNTEQKTKLAIQNENSPASKKALQFHIFQDDLENKERFETLANELDNHINQVFDLTEVEIQSQFRPCGLPDAFYNAETGQITMCSELFQLLSKRFSLEDSLSIFRFVFLHELGHALIHQLKIPILGKEEDAADAFASVLLLEKEQKYRPAVLAAINFMELFKNEIQLPWAANHSLGPQRMFNLICWAGGAKPEISQTPDLLPLFLEMQKSGRNCRNEYQQQNKAFSGLFSKVIKK